MAKSDRGRLLDETLDVFNAAWGPDPVNYRGPTRSSTTPTSCRSRLHRSPSSWAAMSTSAPLEVPMHVCCSGSLDVPTVGCHFSRPWRCWCSEASYGVGLDTPVGGRHRARPVQDGNDRGGNVTFSETPSGDDRTGFSGTLEQILDDIASAASAGADELILDLHLQAGGGTHVRCWTRHSRFGSLCRPDDVEDASDPVPHHRDPFSDRRLASNTPRWVCYWN